MGIFYALIGLSDAAAVMSANLQKRLMRGTDASWRRVMSLNGWVALGALLTLFAGTLSAASLIGPPPTQAAPFTALVGLLYGLLAAGLNGFNLAALSCGPLSLTVLIEGCVGGILIPTVGGVLIWRETVTLFQWGGVAVLVAAMMLLLNPKIDRRITPRWCMLALLNALCSGGIGLLQKWHQSSALATERAGFLTVAFAAYLVIMVFFCLPSFFQKGKKRMPVQRPEGTKTRPADEPAERSERVRYGVGALAVGACVAANHFLNLYLSGMLPAVIFFPLVNGLTIILSTLSGLLFFRERLCWPQWVGMVAGVAALFVVGIA